MKGDTPKQLIAGYLALTVIIASVFVPPLVSFLVHALALTVAMRMFVISSQGLRILAGLMIAVAIGFMVRDVLWML